MLKYLYLSSFLLLTLSLKALPVKDSAEIEQEIADKFVDSVNHAMRYETGVVKLSDDKVEINVPAGFKFLNKEQSLYVLTKLWGNPPSAADGTLGMIFPEASSPFDDSSYVFIVDYEDIGFVKDDDAAKINYDDMLKTMKEDEKATNVERLKGGYKAIHIIGWAEKPYYDKENKVLHWAKEVQFGDDADGNNTLNYQIRLLGRKGVLSLNAVCKMSELPKVNADIDKVLHMATFTGGNSYSDFNPKIDNVAAWTIGGLVAGKILAKVGFFAIILKFFGVFWKFILIGLAAVGNFFRKLFKRKKAEKETPYYTTPAEEGTHTLTQTTEDHTTTEPPALPEAGHADDSEPGV